MAIPAPPWQRQPKARPVRQPLSQELIVDAALGVLQREGLDAVTMRRVAQALDTGAASLYAHVANKDELHKLLYDAVVGLIPTPAPEAGAWQEQMKQFIRDAVLVMRRYPGIGRLGMANIPTGPNALRQAETWLAVLRGGGLADQVAAYACDLIGLFISATAFEEALYLEMGKSQEDLQTYFQQLHGYFKSLPADQFPNMVALVDAMFAWDPDHDDRFEFQLDVLVQGLAHTSWNRKPAGAPHFLKNP